MAPSMLRSFLPLLLFALTALADSQQTKFIVEFDRKLTKRDDGFSSHHEAFHHNAKRADLGYTSGTEYHSDLFAGLAVELSNHADIATLRKLDGVRAVYEDRERTAPISATPPVVHGDKLKRAGNDSFVPHAMTGIDKVHALGNHGRGTTVCVIDTGIDYTHPALGGCLGPGCKVVAGRNYVGDAQGPSDPMDCYGHGTHVAGTVAADPDPLGFVGAAPEANLRGYRVFGCGGKAADSITLKAMLHAADDGCDVITMSLGSSGGWSINLQSTIASRIVNERNIPITIAMGNEGSEGLFFGSSPAASTDAIAVASVDTPSVVGWRAITDTGRQIIYQNAQSFGDAAGFTGELPFYELGGDINSRTATACDPYTGPDLSDGVVLVSLVGNCATETKYAHLQGKVRLILFVRFAGFAQPTRDIAFNSPSQGIWAGSISEDDARTIIQALRAGKKPTASFPAESVSIPNTFSPGLSSVFSTYGPAWLLDSSQASVAAPGGYILSTYPMAKGAYATMSGTSMATPLTAGAIALYLAAKKGDASASLPATLKDIFANTAHPTSHPDHPDMINTVVQQGAGIVDALCAITTDMIASPGQIYLGDEEFLGSSRRITVTNNGKSEVSYRVRHEAAPIAPALNPQTGRYDARVQLQHGSAKVSLSATTISIPAGESRQLVATFTPPDVKSLAGTFPVYSGFIHFSSNSSCDPSVSYHGVAAKLNDMTILRERLQLFREAKPQIQADNVYDPEEDAGDLGFLAYLSAGSAYFGVDIVRADAEIPAGVKVTYHEGQRTRRDALTHAGRPAAHGLKPRRALKTRQEQQPDIPETGDGRDGEQAEEGARLKESLATYRATMDRVFAPFAASLQVVGMLAGGDTQNAPRTSIDNFGKPSSAAEVAFSTVDRAGVSTPLPDGRYRVLIRARRLFGDANSLEGYEAILSDVFVIQRSS